MASLSPAAWNRFVRQRNCWSVIPRGRMARQLALRGCRLIAADVSPQMLAFCREYCAGLTNIEYVLSDGYGIAALPDALVDGAYSFFVFQHMPCRDMARRALADLYRV